MALFPPFIESAENLNKQPLRREDLVSFESISLSQFNALEPLGLAPPGSIATETAWFVDAQRNVIAAICQFTDNQEWAFVIQRRGVSGRFELADSRIGFKTEATVTSAVASSMLACGGVPSNPTAKLAVSKQCRPTDGDSPERIGI